MIKVFSRCRVKHEHVGLYNPLRTLEVESYEVGTLTQGGIHALRVQVPNNHILTQMCTIISITQNPST